MKQRQNIFTLGFFAASLLGACAPMKEPAQRVTLKISAGEATTPGTFSSQAAGDFAFDDSNCYFLHISGDDPIFQKFPTGEDMTCTDMPHAIGIVSGLYKYNDEVGLDIPIGQNRRFDLLAIPKAAVNGLSSGPNETYAPADCSGTITVQMGPRENNPSVMEPNLYLNGVKFKARTLLLATGTSDINPNVNNVVTLTQVKNPDQSLGHDYGCQKLQFENSFGSYTQMGPTVHVGGKCFAGVPMTIAATPAVDTLSGASVIACTLGYFSFEIAPSTTTTNHTITLSQVVGSETKIATQSYTTQAPATNPTSPPANPTLIISPSTPLTVAYVGAANKATFANSPLSPTATGLSWSGSGWAASGTPTTSSAIATNEVNIAPFTATADSSRVTNISVSQNHNQSAACSGLAPNNSISCAINGFSLSFAALTQLLGGSVSIIDEFTVSNSLPVKKYVIQQVSDINAGASDNVSNPVIFGGLLYFNAYDSNMHSRLHQFNPVTNVIKKIMSNSTSSGDDARNFVEYNGELYFAASSPSGYTKGYKLSGDANTLSQFTDTTGGLNDAVRGFAIIGTDMYFGANAGASNGVRVLKFDGTTITRISNISAPAITGGDDPWEFTTNNGLVYFTAQNGVYNIRKIYRFNPASPGITKISNTSGNDGVDDQPEHLTWLNNKLYFVAKNSSGYAKLFGYDPVSDSVIQLSDIYPSGDDFTAGPINPVTVYNNRLYLQAMDALGRSKLFRFDPATAKIQQISDINPGANDSLMEKMVVHSGSLYFQAKKGMQTRLMKYSDVDNRIEQMSEIAGTGPNAYDAISALVSFNGSLYFSATDATYQNKFYKLTEE